MCEHLWCGVAWQWVFDLVDEWAVSVEHSDDFAASPHVEGDVEFHGAYHQQTIASPAAFEVLFGFDQSAEGTYLIHAPLPYMLA